MQPGLTMHATIRTLTSADLPLMEGLVDTFGRAFGEMDVYTSKRPGPRYLQSLLDGDSFIAVVALHEGSVIGGIAAYELRKFEQERSEIYIYDLAVAEQHRRKGVATALIRKLQTIAQARGAYVIYVQADTGVDDEPARRLYSKLGTREEVLHFDIPVRIEAGTG